MYKKWTRDSEGAHSLIFAPYGEEIAVIRISLDPTDEDEGQYDWYYSSELLGDEDEWLCEGWITIEEAQEQAEALVAEHYEGRANYYRGLLRMFKA